MEVAKIDELKHTFISQQVKGRRISGRPCIYYPEIKCTAPNLKMQICKSCPRAANFIKKNVLYDLYRRIKALAISLMNLNI